MSDSSDTGIKVLITVVVIIVAVVAAVVIAKLVDGCYDRRIRGRSAEDPMDNTHELIRARLSVIQYKKREQKKKRAEKALKALRVWIGKVRDRNKNREETISSKRPPGNIDSVVISKDNKDDIEKLENGVSRTPRFPFFTGASLAGGAQKPQKGQKTQKVSSQGARASSESPGTLSPVPKGRPVSSKVRVFPNVIVTNAEYNLPKLVATAPLPELKTNGNIQTVKKHKENIKDDSLENT